MRQVRVHGPGDVRLDDVPEPDPGPAMPWCGSRPADLRERPELHPPRRPGRPGPEPLCLGHEMAGTVEWVGAEVTGARVGDRVVVQPGSGTPAASAAAPDGRAHAGAACPRPTASLHPVPDDLALDVAAFAEPLAVGMHAADQADVHLGDGVAVFGCGPIGLAALATLVDRGQTKGGRRSSRAPPAGSSPSTWGPGRARPHGDRRGASSRILHGTARSCSGPPATAAFIEASGVDRVITDVIDHAAVGARLSVVACTTRRCPPASSSSS